MVQLANGGKMRFAELSLLQGKEKEDIINSMADEEYTRYEQYIESNIEAKNQEEEKVDENIQAANQEADQFAEKR